MSVVVKVRLCVVRWLSRRWPVFDERQQRRRGVHCVHARAVRGVKILLRIALKLLQAALAAEVKGSAFMVGLTGSLGRIDLHAADYISFHSCSRLHWSNARAASALH
jgi:hypothetical protein